MKKLLFITFTVLSIHAIAQTNTFPSSGNVGIGTTIPSYLLDVNGTSNFAGQIWASYHSNIAGFSWADAAFTTNSIEIVNNNGTVNNSSPTLVFHRYGSGGPQFRLDPTGTNVLYLESAYSGSARNPNAYGTNPFFSRFHIDGALTTSGNVGIGTTAPLAKFHVAGDGYSLFGPNSTWGALLRVGGNGNVTNDASVVATNGNLHLDAASGNYATYINHYHGSMGVNFCNGAQSIVGSISAAGNLAMNGTGTFGANTLINGQGNSFFNGGNLGIGTTTPDQKLTVKGKIHAEEVIVDLNVPVADYVFKPDYKLMPLPEIEQFVKTNSHLPEIPSANEISRKGLSVGEMQNKLLQKVEELTLYAIQQNKKIETIQKENEQYKAERNNLLELKKELETLKKK